MQAIEVGENIDQLVLINMEIIVAVVTIATKLDRQENIFIKIE